MNSKHPSIDVVIVHHHAATAAARAVKSLNASLSESAMSLRIFVADNGSTAEERKLLASLPVTVIDVGRNAGYAGAINLAMSHTDADVVVVMNEDVTLTSRCLRELHAALSRGAAVAGPRFYWSDDRSFMLPCTELRTREAELAKVEAMRDPLRLHQVRTDWRRHARATWSAVDPVETISLSGAMIAFTREAWTKVGPFDDEFILYFEEDDWLHRVREAGLKSVCVPTAEAIHHHDPGSAQSAERQRWERESFQRFGVRYYGESFMQKLTAASAEPAVPPVWRELPFPTASISVCADGHSGIWIELTPSPFGFPAASFRYASELKSLSDLTAIFPEHLQGGFFVQIVDDAGCELESFRVTLPGARGGSLQPVADCAVAAQGTVIPNPHRG